MACSFDGCDKKVLAKGLCSGHYMQQWEGRELRQLQKREPGRKCSVEGCQRANYAKGLCNAHWQQSRKDPTLLPLREPGPEFCLHPGCDRVTASREYCQGHWKQIKRGEAPHDLEARMSQVGLTCYHPHCSDDAKAHGLCGRHSYLAGRFNLDEEAVRSLFLDARCAICGTSDPGPKSFHVDHDHSCCPQSGSCGACVRGLLCGKCNAGLGFFRDSTKFLESAVRYLNDWQAHAA